MTGTINKKGTNTIEIGNHFSIMVGVAKNAPLTIWAVQILFHGELDVRCQVLLF